MKMPSRIILAVAAGLFLSSNAVFAQKYDTTGSGDFGGGLEPGARDTVKPAAPSFWNKELAPKTADDVAPLSEFNELNIPPQMFNQGFAQDGQPGQAFGGGEKRNAYGGPTITKGTSQVDLSIMGSGFNTGFKIEKPSEYTEIMKKSRMPSTFNEQGGVDDPLIGF